MKKYENMYLADIQIDKHAPVEIVAAQIEAKRKGLEEKRLYEEEQARRVSITIAEYDELRNLKSKLERYEELFEKIGLEPQQIGMIEDCEKRIFDGVIDNTLHIFFDCKIDKAKLLEK